MKALIDCDILRYEIGFGCQYKDEETGELNTRDYEQMTELFDEKVRFICQSVGATEPPLLFLTNDTITHRLLTKRGYKEERKNNFRDEIAVTKVYKGHRKNEKPLHYTNITAYILDNYEHIVGNGLEADDEMCIYQTKSNEPTVICSRDKDLRICPGLHYTWEHGKQSEVEVFEVDRFGFIELLRESTPKIFGGGLSFFYSQLITGDTADHIPGLPKGGAVLAYKTLSECATERELYDKVSELYRERIGEDWREYLREQANLLWMVQHLNEDGSPVMYQFPEGEDETK